MVKIKSLNLAVVTNRAPSRMNTQTDQAPQPQTPDVVSAARRVTWVGFWVNAALGVLKVLAGIFGRSVAMVADGVHSFSDFITDIIVIVFVGISRRKANENYQYGHGKYETLATLLVAVILGAVGVGFLLDGAKEIWAAFNGQELERPTWLALSMALISIASKEWLYHFTRREGERIGSAVVVANAWHHRSDALSSMATLVGIAGAMFLGVKWRILDPIAALVVAVFIIIVAVEIGRPAVLELLEASLPREMVADMYRIIGSTPGIKAFHQFASRRNGYTKIVDFHIKVDPHITVAQAHDIADDVEHRLRAAYGNDMRINTHVEPYTGQKVDCNHMCTSHS